MDLFGKDLEHRPLDPPGVCFICETTPTQDNTRIVNTNRHFHPGGPTHLTGRKYVCEPCVAELAQVVGMVDGAIADTLAENNAELGATVIALEAKIADLENFQELAARLLPAPKPAAKKKPENQAAKES